MYQRDFILRIIEQLGRALIQLRKRVLGEGLDGVTLRTELGNVAREAGLNLELIRAVDSATLPVLLGPLGEVDPARCWLAGELLFLDLLAARRDGELGGREADVRRALELFRLLPPGWTGPPDIPAAAERIAELDRLLAEAVSKP